MHAKSFGGTCNWPYMGGARLIEVAATAGGTVLEQSVIKTEFTEKPMCAELTLGICTSANPQFKYTKWHLKGS